MTFSTDEIITQTQSWIKSVIIEFNFCPFAKRELERDRIHYKVESNVTPEKALESLILECQRLDGDPEIETTLLILPNNFDDFFTFLDLVALANDLIQLEQYEGIYQVASFHPDYYFTDTERDDASNYTNRSPYPMLHIIRESSMSKALDNYPDPDKIPLRNIEKSRELGAALFQKLLEECKKSKV